MGFREGDGTLTRRSIKIRQVYFKIVKNFKAGVWVRARGRKQVRIERPPRRGDVRQGSTKRIVGISNAGYPTVVTVFPFKTAKISGRGFPLLDPAGPGTDLGAPCCREVKCLDLLKNVLVVFVGRRFGRRPPSTSVRQRNVRAWSARVGFPSASGNCA